MARPRSEYSSLPSPGSDHADVVVIGGGHNGLVCAAYLARAGIDVIVVEKNTTCGGALFGSAIDGCTLEHGAVDHSTIVASTIPEELELRRHGLDYRVRTESAVHLFGDGTQVAIGATVEATARSIAAVDARDADAWIELASLSRELLAFMGEMQQGHPVPMRLTLGLGALALGRGPRSLVSLARMSALDLAERWFVSPHMRALAVFRSQFSGLPPWYPGTGAVFCLSPGGHGRRFARPVGGSAAFVGALESTFTAAGGRILREFDAVHLARRDHGWEVGARDARRVVARRAVVSAIPPQVTLLGLLDSEVPARRVRRRMAGVEVLSGNLAQFSLSAVLAGPPDLSALPEGFGPSMIWMLQSPAAVLDTPTAAWARTLAARPGVLATFPSSLDETAAPDGMATMWVNGFAAHDLNRSGGWAAAAPEAEAAFWSTVECCLPGVRQLVLRSRFMSPADLTARTGALNTGAHVATTLGQLLGGRPARGMASHRSGIGGLYLTGAGTNPGPSISGLPGRACALALLHDVGDRRTWRGEVATTLATEAGRVGKLARRAAAVRFGRQG